MNKKGKQRGRVIIPALAFCFCAGIMVGWWLRSGAPMPAVSQAAQPHVVVTAPISPAVPPVADRPESIELGEVAATTGEPLVAPDLPAPPIVPPATGDAIGDLRRRGLLLPIDQASVAAMKGQFEQGRDAGGRAHEAVDILTPRNTPIRAVEDGTIAKLFESKAGGTTIYQYDPSERFCYYYAHIERYAPGLHEGQRVSRAEVIGYVGTSGNAPPETPHLHFAVFELGAEHHWWKGRAIDPYLIFRP